MKRIDTEIEGVCIIESDCFGDNRGWFMETYNEEKFHSILLDDWVANTEDGDEYDSMKIKVNRWRGTYHMMNDTQFIKTQHYYEIICSPDDYTCYDDFSPEAKISHWTYTSKYAIRNYRFVLLKTDTTFISK